MGTPPRNKWKSVQGHHKYQCVLARPLGWWITSTLIVQVNASWGWSGLIWLLRVIRVYLFAPENLFNEGLCCAGDHIRCLGTAVTYCPPMGCPAGASGGSGGWWNWVIALSVKLKRSCCCSAKKLSACVCMIWRMLLRCRKGRKVIIFGALVAYYLE